MEKGKLANAVSAAGPSLLETLWQELDDIVDRIQADGKPESVPALPTAKNPVTIPDFRDDWMRYGEERGKAQGVAYAIAVITDPYNVYVPRIRKIAARRWKERQA